MNTKTAKKEFRKNKRNHYRNTIIKNNVRKIKKKMLNQKGILKVTGEQAATEMGKYTSILHKMAKKKRIIHANTASRLISRMAKKLSIQN